ncbi:hypothetical protein RclHR1_06350002 [Rhizophagus clarus]|uniref:Uncharacterized protein n=1 Tax=Rhizophagus clarus TaxID=94130 RepID=A0A2Z6RRC6_9GLOM|nr:hypothetical protein RclHR1_06350002 [Rhizophagus clarus]
MSEQNLFVSAFQAEFLLKILARLHISKVQNTKHMNLDSISKIQNFNLKWTEVFEDGNDFFLCLEFNFEADHCPKFHFETDQFKSGTPFRGGPLSETPFQDGLLIWNSFRGELLSRRSRSQYFKGPELEVDRRWTSSHSGSDLHLFRGF